jgi:hypothetical protein
MIDWLTGMLLLKYNNYEYNRTTTEEDTGKAAAFAETAYSSAKGKSIPER